MINLAFSFLVSFLLGFLAVRFFIRDKTMSMPFIAMGLGLGISSILLFIWMVITGSVSNFVYFELGFLLILALLSCFMPRSGQVLAIPGQQSNNRFVFWALSVSFGLIIIVSIISSFFYYSNYSYDDNYLDSINFWLGKAAFFFRSEGHHWSDILNSGNHLLNHPDYPLLLPNSIARTWVYAAEENLLGPTLLSFIFVILTAGVVFFAVKALAGRHHAILAGILLVSNYYFLQTGFRQIADVPLSFYMLCTLCLIMLERRTQSENLFYIMGFAAGLCTWCKNEGLLFFALVVLVRFVLFLPIEGFSKVKADFTKFFMGAAAVLCVLLFFKMNYAVENDLFVNQQGVIDKFFDFSRYMFILKSFYIYAIEKLFGYPLLVLLVGYAFIQKLKPDSDGVTAGLILIAMLVGYFIVYLLTPYDLSVFVGNSIERLLVQLLPSFFVVYFVMLKKTP